MSCTSVNHRLGRWTRVSTLLYPKFMPLKTFSNLAKVPFSACGVHGFLCEAQWLKARRHQAVAYDRMRGLCAASGDRGRYFSQPRLAAVLGAGLGFVILDYSSFQNCRLRLLLVKPMASGSISGYSASRSLSPCRQ